MSNIDKAIEVLNGQGACCGDCQREPGDPLSYCGNCARCLSSYAQALADAGLLTPDLPVHTATSENGTPVWRADKTFMVTAFPGMVGMWIPGIGDAQYTTAQARQQALALLAAANYAEEKK